MFPERLGAVPQERESRRAHSPTTLPLGSKRAGTSEAARRSADLLPAERNSTGWAKASPHPCSRSVESRATAGRGRAEGEWRRENRRGDSYRGESPKRFSFRYRKRLGNVIQIRRQATSQGSRSGPIAFFRCRRRNHLLQPEPQGLVHRGLECRLLSFPDPSEQGVYIVLQCERGSHTSNHKNFDVLMSNYRCQPSRTLPADGNSGSAVVAASR